MAQPLLAQFPPPGVFSSSWSVLQTPEQRPLCDLCDPPLPKAGQAPKGDPPQAPRSLHQTPGAQLRDVGSLPQVHSGLPSEPPSLTAYSLWALSSLGHPPGCPVLPSYPPLPIRYPPCWHHSLPMNGERRRPCCRPQAGLRGSRAGGWLREWPPCLSCDCPLRAGHAVMSCMRLR